MKSGEERGSGQHAGDAAIPARRPRLPRLALVTGDFSDLADLARRTRLALEGGVRWVQLRAKQRSARELYDAARVLRPLTREFAAMLLVNDRADVALAAGADGIHLPTNGLTPRDARSIVGGDLLIGLSVHSKHEIDLAADSGVDYVQFGPVYDTPSKRAFGPAQGLAALAEASATARAANIYLVAIGGTGASRAAEIAAAGADAIAAISAIWEAPDIRGASMEFVAAANAAFAAASTHRGAARDGFPRRP